MRYIDSGMRLATEVLGAWLQAILDTRVSELRWQMGFFSADSLSILAGALNRLAENDSVVRAIVGSNAADTTRADLSALAELMRIPRPHAALAVASFGYGLFHPKTLHIKRINGSEAAYVGSANLTAAGLALNIEAGITMDSEEGDDPRLLSSIAAAIDYWFEEPRPGIYRIEDLAELAELVQNGILSEIAPRRPASSHPASGSVSVARPRLLPLLRVPPLGSQTQRREVASPASALASAPPVPRPDFPPYLLFDPGATTPTIGIRALSGASLPGNAAGLIIRLNRDSARRFRGGGGTANLSIPVATVGTFRFGIFRRTYERPRAEYSLRLRYWTGDAALSLAPVMTNVMAYGFSPGESGHGDIRMVVPAAVRALAERVLQEGFPVPSEGDVALLEWPSIDVPEFRLTFLAPSSDLYREATGLFESARGAGQLVGGGAWLPPSLPPPW